MGGVQNAGKSIFNGVGWLLGKAGNGTEAAINATETNAKWVNGELVSGGTKIINGTLKGGKEVLNVTENAAKGVIDLL